MVIYISVAALTVFLGLTVDNHCRIRRGMVSRQQMLNALCLCGIFFILFAVSACRLNVGNDYAKYVEFMHLIRCDAFVPTEIGFNQIVKILYGISGFENYLLVFAFFDFCFCLPFTDRRIPLLSAFSCLWLSGIISSPLTRSGIIWRLP